MKRYIFILVLLQCLSLFNLNKVVAQDVHLSQFYASPLSLNPAYTGDYKGDWRLMNSYRNQWLTSFHAPYTTNAFAYDRQFYLFNENISGGIIWVQDKSGDAMLKVTKIALSLAYHKTIQANTFHIGYQAGFVQKGFSADKLSYPNQYNGDPDKISQGLFDVSMPNNENFAGEQLSYFDMNLGFSYSRKFNLVEPKIGFSLFHLNRPKESFFDKDPKLPMRSVLDLSAKVDLSAKFFLMPKVLYMYHASANEMVFGSNLGYKLRENKITAKSVFGGILLRSGAARNTDAFVCIAGVNFKNLDLGISYDNTISDLQLANNHIGGFELSIIYTGMSTLLEKKAIPCDRY